MHDAGVKPPIHLVNTVRLLEQHEAEAPGAAGHRVQLQSAVHHLSELGEVILQVFLGGVPAQPPHKHLPVEIRIDA